MVDILIGQKAGGAIRSRTIALVGAATLLLAGCGGHQTKNNGPNPTKPGATQKIQLIWKQATKTWMVIMPGNPHEQDPKTALTLLAYGVGPTEFDVSIHGGSTTPTFKSFDALSVWPGDKSAPQSGINSTQILGPIVAGDGKTLVFYDLNQGDPVKLSYSLSFNEAGVPPADPIINNGGGPGQQ